MLGHRGCRSQSLLLLLLVLLLLQTCRVSQRLLLHGHRLAWLGRLLRPTAKTAWLLLLLLVQLVLVLFGLMLRAVDINLAFCEGGGVIGRVILLMAS